MDDGISSPPDLKSPLALVVDDNPANRLFAKGILTSLGYETQEAFNGLDALSVLRKSAREVKLMILDLSMPAMDGYGVLAEQDSWRWHPLVIVWSAYIPKNGDKAAILSGASSILGKPTTLEQLKTVVRQVQLG